MKLDDLPDKGKVVIASPADENLLVRASEFGDFDYKVDNIVPKGAVYVLDMDAVKNFWEPSDER